MSGWRFNRKLTYQFGYLADTLLYSVSFRLLVWKSYHDLSFSLFFKVLLGTFKSFQAYSKYAADENMKVLEPEDVANAVLFAVSQPEHSAVNSILVEPRLAPA